jgi:hypothetical protein
VTPVAQSPKLKAAAPRRVRRASSPAPAATVSDAAARAAKEAADLDKAQLDSVN